MLCDASSCSSPRSRSLASVVARRRPRSRRQSSCIISKEYLPPSLRVKRCSVAQNSPQPWLSLPWPVITAARRTRDAPAGTSRRTTERSRHWPKATQRKTEEMPPALVVTSAHGVSTAGSDAAARGGGVGGVGVARRRSVVTHRMALVARQGALYGKVDLLAGDERRERHVGERYDAPKEVTHRPSSNPACASRRRRARAQLDDVVPLRAVDVARAVAARAISSCFSGAAGTRATADGPSPRSLAVAVAARGAQALRLKQHHRAVGGDLPLDALAVELPSRRPPRTTSRYSFADGRRDRRRRPTRAPSRPARTMPPPPLARKVGAPRLDAREAGAQRGAAAERARGRRRRRARPS